jgi:short subunit dehydrogenase-like uncharacterized protein
MPPPPAPAAASRAAVFGGYGTFGALVARELARLGVAVTVAGRDGARAEAFARTLGPAHRGLAADVNSRESCRAALRGHAVAVSCAGPFSAFGPALLEACLDAGCHYADLADDRRYTALVRGHDDRFRRAGLTAVHGCSSLPGISGALALTAAAGAAAVPRRARVTLFVGNANAKGGGAIRSVVGLLGRPIPAPQGMVRGFRDREVVPLPQPFGPRAVFNFEAPEYDLFPELLGVQSVSVKIGLELTAGTYGLALLAALGSHYGRRTAALLEWLGGWVGGVGSSGGAVMTELFFADGSTRRAALVARRDGQRMAALPCAVAAHALASGPAKAAGVLAPYEFLGASALLERLAGEGFELHEAGS